MILSRVSARKIPTSGPFHSSATRLWNGTEPSLRDTCSQKCFLSDLQRKLTLENSVTERFNIDYTY